MAKNHGHQVVVRMDDALARELGNACARTGGNMSEVTRVLVRRFVNEVTEQDIADEQARRRVPPGSTSRVRKARQYLETLND